MRTRLTAVAVASLIVSAMGGAQGVSQGASQATAPSAGIAERYFAAVRPVLSGFRAKETVAYMDRFVRWPGNPGFDSSIAHVAAKLMLDTVEGSFLQVLVCHGSLRGGAYASTKAAMRAARLIPFTIAPGARA